MENFGTIVNGYKPLSITNKLSILDVWLDLDYTSVPKVPKVSKQTFSLFDEKWDIDLKILENILKKLKTYFSLK